MRDKIKQISTIGWIAIIGSSLGLAILLPSASSYLADIYSLDPWQNAKIVAVLEAINNFSEGSATDSIYYNHLIGALTGVLLFFIIGPGFMILYGFGSSEDSKSNHSLLGFSTGLTITLAGLLMFGIETTQQTVADNSEAAKKNALITSRSAATDDLRQQMVALAADSFEYLVLPEEQGGGGGSFSDLKINELPSYGHSGPGTFSFTETNSDTLLRIVGTVKPDLQNDGDSNPITVIARVSPSDIISWEKNN